MKESVEIAAIVLAAGKSERMGGSHKLLLPIAGKTIIACLMEKLVRIPFKEIVVIVGFQQEAVRHVIDTYPVRIVTNTFYVQGLSTSIIAGIQNISPAVSGYLFLPADMPLITEGIIQRLIKVFRSFKGEKIVFPEVAGKQRNPVIFPVRFKEDLLSLKGDQGGKLLIRQFSEQAISVPFDNPLPFRDIDTMEDYRELVKEFPKGSIER